ncbi:MAG: class E sortase [Micrococcales bacterium]
MPKIKLDKVLHITGELLITAGVLLGLFAFWQVYISDSMVGQDQTSIAENYQPAPDATQNVSAEPSKTLVDVSAVSKEGENFAKLYIPRFSKHWERIIGEGTRWAVLNTVGVGHYSKSQMPGEVGNFAVAGHRGGFGGSFKNVDHLQAGDKVWVETNDGWYVYKYLQTKIVLPTDVSVISKVPGFLDAAKKGGKYFTMTSCEPIFVNTHRIIAWFELEAAFPLDFGMPQELKDLRGE